MNVRFIDTSIMCNLLEVPKMCDDKEEVKQEWKEVLEKTAESKAPWTLYGNVLDSKEIKYIAENLEQFTLAGTGIGDMTIIYAYEKYLREEPAIGTIMIWSRDEHLSAYRQENVSLQRRRKR